MTNDQVFNKRQYHQRVTWLILAILFFTASSELVAEYRTHWSAQRMDHVITAAVRNHIAIEINSRYAIPRARFIKRAKKAGVNLPWAPTMCRAAI